MVFKVVYAVPVVIQHNKPPWQLPDLGSKTETDPGKPDRRKLSMNGCLKKHDVERYRYTLGEKLNAPAQAQAEMHRVHAAFRLATPARTRRHGTGDG